jgi:hypothetical protein
MQARSRFSLQITLASALLTLAAARPALAQQLLAQQSVAQQSVVLQSSAAPQASQEDAPIAQPAPVTESAATAGAQSGPTMDAASVAVRQPVSHENRMQNAAPRRAGYGQPVALMVVGGAALLAGLIIGGGAGTAIAVGGAVIGLYGLYEFLQ